MRISTNKSNGVDFNINRLPPDLQHQLTGVYQSEQLDDALEINQIYHGDARKLLPKIQTNSVSLSICLPLILSAKNTKLIYHLKIGRCYFLRS